MAKYGGVSGQSGSGSELDPKLQEDLLRKGQSKKAQEQTDESSSTEPQQRSNNIVNAAQRKLKREELDNNARKLAEASGTSGIKGTLDNVSLQDITRQDPLNEEQKRQGYVEPSLTNSFFSGEGWYNSNRTKDRNWLYQRQQFDIKTDDAGFFNRAERAADYILAGAVLPGVSPTNISTDLKQEYNLVTQQDQQQNYNPFVQRGISDRINQDKRKDPNARNKGSLVAAAAASGAVVVNEAGHQVPNRNFLMTGLAMVEHAFADWSYLNQDVDALYDDYGNPMKFKEAKRKKDLIELGVDITKARGNYALGQKIHQEYQRGSGQDTTKISQEDAAILGDMFKELYYEFNGRRINPTKDSEGKPIKSSKKQGTTSQFPSFNEKQIDDNNQPLHTPLLTRDEQANGETIFTLTPHGKNVLQKGRTRRELTFNKEIIKPLTAPIDDTAAMEAQQEMLMRSGGQVTGDKRNFTKRVLGKIRNVFVGKQLDSAMTNASSMAHAVDDNRLKIGLSMFFTSIGNSNEENLSNPAIAWMSEGLGLGRSKVFEYQTEERLSERELAPLRASHEQALDQWFNNNQDFDRNNPEDIKKALQQVPQPIELKGAYKANRILQQQRRSLAQELHAGVEGRNKANYLTYSTLGFNQRILPQQTYFNPVTSKFVRAITRSVIPDFIRNPLDEKALRQMYATHLLPGNLKADKKLPDQREVLLINYEKTLNAWGERLTEAMTLDNSSFNKLSELINNKVAIQDIKQQNPELIQAATNNLMLDPEADADLLLELMDQGQEAISYIDGLMDFSKYYKAKDGKAGLGLTYTNGKQFSTYFNFHIDGMTNGTASNGLQMGDVPTAMRTGVLRVGKQDLLDEGDVRDILMETAPTVVDTDPFELSMQNEDTIPVALDHIQRLARNVFGNRQLHKDTTMTYGYGKELESFWVNFVDALELQYTKYQWEIANAESAGLNKEDVILRQQYVDSMDWMESKINDKDVFTVDIDGLEFSGLEAAARLINQKYKSPLTQVMSDQGIRSRALMRGTAAMYAAMDERWTMEGPTQMLEFGKDISMGYDDAVKGSYNLYRPDLDQGSNRGRLQRKSPVYRVRSSAAAMRLKNDVNVPGDWAWGGSLPGPIQAIDAAVVARTFSGNSFNKISNANGGNPYVFSIYDAFKGTANNYWTVLEETNTNWVKANKDFSYLQSAKNSLQKTKNIWDNEIAQRIKQNPNEKVGITESSYLSYVLRPGVNDKGDVEYFNLKKLINSLYAKDGFNRNDPAQRRQAYESIIPKFEKNMEKVGYIMGSTLPPNKIGEQLDPSVNVRQLKMFVDTFYDMLGSQVTSDGTTTNIGFLERIQSMANTSDKQKKVLFDLLKSRPKYDASGKPIKGQRKGYKLPSTGNWIALQYFGA